MAGFNETINRGTTPDPLVPQPFVAEVIKELPQASAVMASARRVTMSNKTTRMPVLSALPEAYFVAGDAGLKQTTSAAWENLELVAEEIAVIVVIPDAYFDDAAIPLWDEVRPLVVEAFGRKIDRVTLFGTDKPSTWGGAIVPLAVASGHTVVAGTGGDFGVDVAAAARLVANDGFAVNRFVSGPGLQWELIGARDAQGRPVYSPSIAEGQPNTLYGFPLNESLNDGFDTTAAKLICGDWNKAIVGVRQEMRAELFDQAVISDADGKVIVNLMQQDSKAMRFTMRLGWQVANPVTPTARSKAQRFPFAAVVPAD